MGESFAFGSDIYKELGELPQTDDPGTGLIDFNARAYDPVLGRFVMADTVLDGTNRYTYVHNNPTGLVDPSGNETCTVEARPTCWNDAETIDLNPDLLQPDGSRPYDDIIIPPYDGDCANCSRGPDLKQPGFVGDRPLRGYCLRW